MRVVSVVSVCVWRVLCAGVCVVGVVSVCDMSVGSVCVVSVVIECAWRRVTSLVRDRHPVGPCSRTGPGLLWCS